MNGASFWLERLLSRYGAKTTHDRIGFALARSCDERGVVWISVKTLRLRLIAIWPELLDAPKRGRHGSGISHDRLRKSLAAHPDWETLGRARYPDKRLGPAIRVLSDAVRREIGHPVPFAEAAKWPQGMAAGEAAWLSHFPEPKWPDTSNPKPKTQRTLPERRRTLVVPAALDVTRELEQLPAWLPLHSLEWEI
jgi:hypothetical protein